MLVNRMIRAAMLDPRLYEEVEHDRNATSQALQVVIIVALASGIGGALWKLLTLNPIDAVSGLIGGILVAVLGWLVWALVTLHSLALAYLAVKPPTERCCVRSALRNRLTCS